MTVELEFKDWWLDFRHQHRNDKDFCNELNCLKTEVGSFTQKKREVFIDELLKLEIFDSYACELISLFGTEKQIQLIKTKALNLINQELTDNALPYYIDLILEKYQKEDGLMLQKYFLDYQNKETILIPGKLFDIHRDLFLQAFSIKIENYPIKKLCDHDGLLYMTGHLEALKYLIENLPFTLSRKLKLFSLSKTYHTYAQHDTVLKNRLMELADLKESEIEKIKQIRLKDMK